MSINFCGRCNSLLKQVDCKWKCISCGTEYENLSLSSIELISENKEIAIINEKDSEVLPKMEWLCPRCKNNEAFFWHMITTAADEADTIFQRCTKCSLTVQKGGQRGGR